MSPEIGPGPRGAIITLRWRVANGLKNVGCGHCKASGCLKSLLGSYSRKKPSFIQQFPDANGHDWVAKRSLLDRQTALERTELNEVIHPSVEQ